MATIKEIDEQIKALENEKAKILAEKKKAEAEKAEAAKVAEQKSLNNIIKLIEEHNKTYKTNYSISSVLCYKNFNADAYLNALRDFLISM